MQLVTAVKLDLHAFVRTMNSVMLVKCFF